MTEKIIAPVPLEKLPIASLYWLGMAILERVIDACALHVVF